MAVEEKDPVSGQKTTGHEWNGIKELDTPVPLGILIFIVVTHVWALLWWVLMPTFPLGTTYTKGILDTDQRKIVEQDLTEAQAQRAARMRAIETSSYEDILANEDLMKLVRTTGHQLFGDNCAACHGADGRGRANYPDLTDEDWLWGGGPEKIAETMKIGINSTHQNTRVAQMPAFGRDAILDRNQVTNVGTYVQSLSDPAVSTAQNIEQMKAGREIFLTTCAACHGEDGKGNREVGAPNLTDQHWVYGGDLQTIINTIHGGRQGHMPTWDERLSPAEIKILSLYVASLGTKQP
ncbi:cytochrome-c oxidase, cbb3-type subunit III [Microvirga sp. BT689]|uniref:cytochrome-c oxidase, cbb3-type subunit III n=1 Tax=Microvirga arvi TaxID=2778731 RepID=UPI0019520F92|nr:cytochrome-c oxidase, cbb3-type subunit III [Microvirga arvi]MBM6583402.1 cytochrome-c oxidase, cbb3-type subunit III [Microvirga arvi]